jgi:hypothetical protein
MKEMKGLAIDLFGVLSASVMFGVWQGSVPAGLWMSSVLLLALAFLYQGRP